MFVGGRGVFVGGTGVSVGGIGVSVGGAGVWVGAPEMLSTPLVVLRLIDEAPLSAETLEKSRS